MAVVAAAQPSCSSAAAATKQARLITEFGGDDCAGATLIPATLLRGGIKNLVFYFRLKKGVSANPKNPYQKILKIF